MPRVRVSLTVEAQPHIEIESRHRRFLSRFAHPKCVVFALPRFALKTARIESEPRGRKSCWIKRGGQRLPLAQHTSPRNAGRGTFLAGVTFCRRGHIWDYPAMKDPLLRHFLGI